MTRFHSAAVKAALNIVCVRVWLERILPFFPRSCFTFKGLFYPAFLLVALAVFFRPVEAQSVYSQAYTFSTFAGYSRTASADGAGSDAQFIQPVGVVLDTNGNLFVADTFSFTIRKITPAGDVTTIAGFPGDPGSADGTNGAARFNEPAGIAIDNAGNLYVADNGSYIIRKISPVGTNWVVSTIAGLAQVDQNGKPVPGSADGIGSVARFNQPLGIAVDHATNVYVADSGNNTIRQITPVGTNWVVSTIAGSAGKVGSTNSVGTNSLFDNPCGVAVDNAGGLYVADTSNSTVRKLTLSGTNWVASAVAGSAGISGSSDGTNTLAQFNQPQGIAVGAAGNIFVADTSNSTIRKVTRSGTNWVVTTFAGTAGYIGGADGTGSDAIFYEPCGVAADAAGNVYVADTLDDTIREITSDGVVSTLAGTAGGGAGYANGTGSTARFYQPFGVAVNNGGYVYVADSGTATIRLITPSSLVTTIAGSDYITGSVDDVGFNAEFYEPQGIAVDIASNVYVADTSNCTIRLITPAGVVSTLAGSAGSSGSVNGTNAAARFNQPFGVAVDNATNLFVADTMNCTIRKIAPIGTNWVVSTIAGFAGSIGSTDGSNSTARFYDPESIVADSAGSLYVADTGNHTIRKLKPSGTNWIVSTIAGVAGKSGSADGVGTNALFNQPSGIAADSATNLYVVDQSSYTIRKLIPVGTNWIVSTIGGLAGVIGGSDGTGNAARFYNPSAVTVDRFGNVFIADQGNNAVRKGVFTAYGAANPVAYSPPSLTGQLGVILEPPGANGQWRFTWDQFWRNSGDVVSNLAQGNYPLIFRDEPGYLAYPATNSVAVLSNSTTWFTNQYLPTINTGAGGTGSLTVDITPNAPHGAGWQFIGGTTSNAPDSTVSGLQPDTYFIQFEPVSGWSTPPVQLVQVAAGQNTTVFANYLLTQSPPSSVLLPQPVPTNSINDMTDYPFGFNGQLVTDVGYGSGVAVQTNVVLTAAHLLFNDYTLSYASQAYWYFEEEAGVSQPEPQIARGWYMLTDYASQRTNDLLGGYSPDQSSPQSRNDDAAAVYFLSPCAGGASAGYLPSDAASNTWLTSTSLKMLVGYPVDGSDLGQAIVPEQMYYTQPQPYPLSPATDPVPDQQVYNAPWFLSFPGNSGGPLFVQLNGTYYPAGIYLGTAYSGVVPYASYVRAIDSAVVNLITNAASYGDSGTNNSGGGVITIVPSQEISASKPGYLQVLIGPSAALAAGGAWKLGGQPDSDYSIASNFTQAVITTNTIALQFRTNVPGWNPPTNRSVALFPNQFSTVNANYTVTNPVLYASPSGGIAITGTTGTTYLVEYSTNLLNGPWLPLQTNTLSAGNNLLLPPPSPTNPPAVFYRAQWLP